MNNLIGIVGGDLRLTYLAKELSKENNVFVYAQNDEILIDAKVTKCSSLNQISNCTDTIITSIPLTKDKITIYAPYSNERLDIEKTFEMLKNKKIFCGGAKKEILEIASKNNIEIIDFLENEELAVLNAIPTAEGAIEIAMHKSNITLCNSNVLVLGFGRIGKILSKMLNGIGANVYCEARKDSDIAKIISYGYNCVELKNLDNNLEKYDFIFNTIPFLILDKNRLEKINKECLIIDLASQPGGVDFDIAKKLNLNASLELALPGKVAPKTAAIYLKNVIEKI